MYHNVYTMWKFVVVVLLSMMAASCQGRIFTRTPGNVTVLKGSQLWLRWETSITAASTFYCHWEWRATHLGAWLRFIGFANNARERLIFSSMHKGWEFTNDIEPCKGGIWRNDVNEDYGGFYKIYVIDRSDKIYSKEAFVSLVQPADLKCEIFIKDTSRVSDLSEDMGDPDTIILSRNQMVPVNVSLTWPKNSVNSISISQEKQYGRCQKRNSSQPGPYRCEADVGVYNETNKISQLVVNITSTVQGAESVIVQQNLEWTGAATSTEKVECSSVSSLATTFIILFVVAVLTIISMLCLYLLKIRKKTGNTLQDLKSQMTRMQDDKDAREKIEKTEAEQNREILKLEAEIKDLQKTLKAAVQRCTPWINDDFKSMARRPHKRRYFFICSMMHGMVLDVPQSNWEPGVKVIMWYRNKPTSDNQLWYTDCEGIIRSKLTDFCLHTQTNGKYICVQPYTNEPNQLWTPQGTMTIVLRQTPQLCLDICNEDRKTNAKLIQCEYKGTENQHWLLDYIDESLDP